MKKILYFIVFILSLEIAAAAILQGTIYDTKFNKLNDVLVEVNSIGNDSASAQRFVSKEGKYSFVLDHGEYRITAKYRISGYDYLYAEDNITITTDKFLTNDLLLKPARKVDMPTGAALGIGGIMNYSILISVISIILVVSLGYTIYKLKFSNRLKEQFDQPTDELLRVIKAEGGRTTQKDIRKKIPLSEAKISLMISELENKGILKKLKKGRGNIIILK